MFWSGSQVSGSCWVQKPYRTSPLSRPRCCSLRVAEPAPHCRRSWLIAVGDGQAGPSLADERARRTRINSAGRIGRRSPRPPNSHPDANAEQAVEHVRRTSAQPVVAISVVDTDRDQRQSMSRGHGHGRHLTAGGWMRRRNAVTSRRPVNAARQVKQNHRERGDADAASGRSAEPAADEHDVCTGTPSSRSLTPGHPRQYRSRRLRGMTAAAHRTPQPRCRAISGEQAGCCSTPPRRNQASEASTTQHSGGHQSELGVQCSNASGGAAGVRHCSA